MTRKECPFIHGPLKACIKDSCAWYLNKSKKCAIPLIASKIREYSKDDSL